MRDKSPIIVALDSPDQQRAEEILRLTSPFIGVYKVGLEFFLANGIEGVKKLRGISPEVDLFLDLKLHDIPNTVKGAAQSISSLQPRFLTVHASGGGAMIQAASTALPHTLITAVTVLTSLDAEELGAMGFRTELGLLSEELATNSLKYGAKALVCSPHEVAAIRKRVGSEIILITPGVRPKLSQNSSAIVDDQKRTMTPQEALNQGSDYLVIGRPITGSDDPASSAREILEQLS